MGAAANHLRHSVAAAQRARHDRQQRLAEREHHAAHSVPAEAGSAAAHLHDSGPRLRRASAAVDHHGGAESGRRPVRCQRNDYTA